MTYSQIYAIALYLYPTTLDKQGYMIMVKTKNHPIFAIAKRYRGANTVIRKGKIKGKTVMKFLSGQMLVIETYLPVHASGIDTLATFATGYKKGRLVDTVTKITSRVFYTKRVKAHNGKSKS